MYSLLVQILSSTMIQVKISRKLLYHKKNLPNKNLRYHHDQLAYLIHHRQLSQKEKKIGLVLRLRILIRQRPRHLIR